MKELRFSQRIGKTEIRTALQIDSMDRVLRNRLWNAFSNTSVQGCYYLHHNADFQTKCELNFFYNIADFGYTVTEGDYLCDWLTKSCKWYEVYDFMEFLVGEIPNNEKQTYIAQYNLILEEEKSAYRFINGVLSPIISEVEIKSIETAINDSGWSSVSTHLEKALIFFSDRKNPDYSNSIKEAISAVEAALTIITGQEKHQFAAAIKYIETNYKIETALKTSFLNLYGYTSDKDGIRHALMEGESGASCENAQFMLVACSAFINYLKVKTKK